MKHYLPKKTEDGAALIITLLIVVLLATISVSFFSTTRTEQTATRNYTSKTQAEQFATMATQQAMAKIQQGFTVNATGTTVITTQPGAIRQFVFLNGTITSNTTVDLFSGTGNTTSNGTANLNNLQNPGNATSSATSNEWTITGNASEAINIPLEEIRDSAGKLVGRIAYYVDDEGTKLNLNAAMGDRPSLNIASSRSLSLSTLANASQSANFTEIINGNVTNAGNPNSHLKNWAHFSRPEQVGAAVQGFISGEIPKVSTAPMAETDYHLKKTPWGADRVFINDLAIDSTGVNAIYEALSGKNATTGNLTADQGLRNIYGTTFADKYTDAGLKQIAANMLQARDRNVLNDPALSLAYNGTLLGASGNNLVSLADCCSNVKPSIPRDYIGRAPYPFINEIGVTLAWACVVIPSQNRIIARPNVRPFISIINPERSAISKNAVDEWQIEMQIDSLTYDVTHQLPPHPMQHSLTHMDQQDTSIMTLGGIRWLKCMRIPQLEIALDHQQS